MSATKAKAASLLLLGAALIGACDRSPPPAAPGPSAARTLKAADPACRLPLGHFAPSLRQLVGSILTPSKNLVVVDRRGRILWNGEPIDRRLLREYLATAMTLDPPPYLKVYPDKDAHCATVQEALAIAIEVGRCSPQRCAFEWPPGNPPPPPLLPEPSQLLGAWVLVSIDDAAPPANAYPVELTFTEGAVDARSQCVTYDWRIAVEDGRLKLWTPPGRADSCFRTTSEWENRFAAAMAAAAYIERVGEELIVTGPKGRLRLKRPG